MHNTYFDYTNKLSIKEKAAAIKAAGFRGAFVFFDEFLDETISELRAEGLEIETIHLPFKNCNYLWVSSPLGDEYVACAIKGIEAAKRYNIKTVVFHISSKDNPPAYGEIGLNRLKSILEVAEKLDINLALENLRRLDYLDYCFDNLKSNKLKFCFDSGHANAFTKNLATFNFEKYKDKLICVHFSDNFGDEDAHLVPFMGNIDWKELGRNLKKIAYKGPLTCEAIIKEGIDPWAGLIKIKKALEKIENYLK